MFKIKENLWAKDVESFSREELRVNTSTSDGATGSFDDFEMLPHPVKFGDPRSLQTIKSLYIFTSHFEFSILTDLRR